MALEKYYKLSDVAKQLSTTKLTLYKHIEKGLLKADKIGSRWIVSERALEEYLHSRNK